MQLFFICVTAIICVALISGANVSITIKHEYINNTEETQDIQEVYDEISKDGDNPPNFADVIDVINKEFGGVDYGEEN